MDKNYAIALKRWVVFNAYGDRDLAKRASKWSNEHILRELGIDLTKRKSFTKKTLTEKQIKNRLQSYQDFKNIKQYFGAKEAYKYSRSKYSKKDRQLIIKGPKQQLQEVGLSKQFSEKKKEWSKWSTHPKGHPELGFPPFVLKVVEAINLERGLDIRASYGFAIINFVYVRNYTYNEAEETIKTDVFATKGFQYKDDVLM